MPFGPVEVPIRVVPEKAHMRNLHRFYLESMRFPPRPPARSRKHAAPLKIGLKVVEKHIGSPY